MLDTLALVDASVLDLNIYLYVLFNTEGSYFDSNGVRLHYTEAGAGTPVILVHG